MNFQERIAAFNTMYRLPVETVPSLTAVGTAPNAARDRLVKFKKILSAELDEIDDIIEALDNHMPSIAVLTMLADLLGDIQVYAASEMAKFGLPLDAVLSIIMDSNASKLGADGMPIYDADGKVQKGPGYWKPEPTIMKMLEALGQ